MSFQKGRNLLALYVFSAVFRKIRSASETISATQIATRFSKSFNTAKNFLITLFHILFRLYSERTSRGHKREFNIQNFQGRQLDRCGIDSKNAAESFLCFNTCKSPEP